MLDNIRVVLVNTSHPGNIGSVARAMKTMGLTQLYLVDPLDYPSSKASALASNAQDVLEQAVVVSDVQAAIADCHLIVGTSTRTRTIPWPVLTPRSLTEKLKSENPEHKIAILFGREQTGLTNDELQLCHYHIQIPSNPNYSSLNLAQAVQVIAYELFVEFHDQCITDITSWDFPPADGASLEKFYVHLENVLVSLDFLKPTAPRQLMPRLQRLFNRARMDTMEMNIMRGILSAVEKKINS